MKRKLINSFLVLATSSAISKIFSILNRMLLSRLLPIEAMSLYLVIMPTLSLCITLGQVGIPSAIFRLVLHPKYNNLKIIVSGIIISLFSVVIICLSLFIFSPYIADVLLKNHDCLYPILSFLIFIPLIAISGIIKNFYLAKGHVYIIAKSQIIEECSRLLFIYLLLKDPLSNSLAFLVTIAYLAMSFGELMSIIYLVILSISKYPYKQLTTIKHQDLITKELLNISLPLTGSRLYHCFTSFLEPIVLIHVLTNLQISQADIQKQYAIISGYVVSLLVTPTFFCNVIYRLYLPIATKDLYYNDSNTFKHLLYALLACLLIGLPFSLIFYFFPKEILRLIYGTSNGYQQLKYLAIPFIIFYLQTPLSTILQATNKNKLMFIISIIECTLEIIITYLLSPYLYVNTILISLLIGLLTTLTISGYYCYFIIKNIS